MRGSLYIVLVMVVVAYYNSFFGVFQFDDYNVIVDNVRVHSWQAFMGELPFTIRPLLKFTYTLNWTSGLGLFGFHLINLTIHIVNTILVYHLCKALQSRQASLNNMETIPLLTTVFFALHPIQTESVTYICGRSSSMMAMFILISIISYIKGVEKPHNLLIYFLSPLSYVLAVATKEVALFMPLMLIAYDYIYIGRVDFLRRQWVHWMLLFFAILIISFTKRYIEILNIRFQTTNLLENATFILQGIFYNISKVFFLSGLNIDPTPSLLYNNTLIYLIVLIIVVVSAIFSTRQHKWFAFAFVWFAIFLLPYMLIPRGDVLNERNIYVSLIGFFFGLSIVTNHIITYLSLNVWIKRVLLSILVIFLCFSTHQRNSVYHSEISLWEDTVVKSPDNSRALINLGYAYSQKGLHDKADEFLKKGLEFDRLRINNNPPKNYRQ